MREVTLEKKKVTCIKLTITPTRAVLKYDPDVHTVEELDWAFMCATRELKEYDDSGYQFTIRGRFRKPNGSLSWHHDCLPEYKRTKKEI